MQTLGKEKERLYAYEKSGFDNRKLTAKDISDKQSIPQEIAIIYNTQ